MSGRLTHGCLWTPKKRHFRPNTRFLSDDQQRSMCCLGPRNDNWPLPGKGQEKTEVTQEGGGLLRTKVQCVGPTQALGSRKRIPLEAAKGDSSALLIHSGHSGDGHLDPPIITRNNNSDNSLIRYGFALRTPGAWLGCDSSGHQVAARTSRRYKPHSILHI